MIEGFADRLRQAYFESGLTSMQVEKRTGVTHAALLNWMNQNRTPKFDGIAKVADALGVSLDWLAYGKGSDR